MKFVIQINVSPYGSNGGLTAYQFIETLLRLNHQVVRVFFYYEGVYHAFRYRIPPDDELQLTEKWNALAKQYQLDLVVCISAAQRRGLLSADEAKKQGKLDEDIATGFRIGGLGQLIEAMLTADRYIEFG